MSAKIEVVEAFFGRLSGTTLFKGDILSSPSDNPPTRKDFIRHSLRIASAKRKDIIPVSRFIQDPGRPAYKK